MIFFPGFPTGNPGKTVHKKKTTGNAAGEAEKFYIYHRKEKSPVIEQRQVRQPLQNHVAILPKYSVSEFMGYFREKSKPPPGGGGFFPVGRARSLRGGMPLSAESDRRCCSTCGAPAPSIFSFAKEEQERKRGETICRSTIWRQRRSVVGLAAPPEWPMMQMSSTKSMEYISY